MAIIQIIILFKKMAWMVNFGDKCSVFGIIYIYSIFNKAHKLQDLSII